MAQCLAGRQAAAATGPARVPPAVATPTLCARRSQRMLGSGILLDPVSRLPVLWFVSVYFLTVLVLPLAVGGAVTYRSLPCGRECPRCRHSTLLLSSPHLPPALPPAFHRAAASLVPGLRLAGRRARASALIAPGGGRTFRSHDGCAHHRRAPSAGRWCVVARAAGNVARRPSVVWATSLRRAVGPTLAGRAAAEGCHGSRSPASGPSPARRSSRLATARTGFTLSRRTRRRFRRVLQQYASRLVAQFALRIRQ